LLNRGTLVLLLFVRRECGEGRNESEKHERLNDFSVFHVKAKRSTFCFKFQW
jgi:hypothetical protein